MRPPRSQVDEGPIAIKDSQAPLEPVTVVVPPVGVNLEQLECAIIRFALERHEGNRTHAAAFLRVSRSALLYRMNKYRIGDVSGTSHQEPGNKR